MQSQSITSSLYNSEKFSDYKINVRGTTFFCHKNILSSITYFDVLFGSKCADADKELIVSETDPLAYRNLLMYIYGFNIKSSKPNDSNMLWDDMNEEQLVSLIQLSHMIDVKPLLKHASHLLVLKVRFDDLKDCFNSLLLYDIDNINQEFTSRIKSGKSWNDIIMLLTWLDLGNFEKPDKKNIDDDKYALFYSLVCTCETDIYKIFKIKKNVDVYFTSFLNSFINLSATARTTLIKQCAFAYTDEVINKTKEVEKEERRKKLNELMRITHNR